MGPLATPAATQTYPSNVIRLLTGAPPGSPPDIEKGVGLMGASDGLGYRTAKDVVRLLATRQVSAVELLERAVARIEARDPQINAVVVRDFERARDAAKAAEAALARGERAPLLGLPMTVKEPFNVAGLPTTWGVPAARNWRPNEDALAIARLKAAGAVVLGKTNVPLWLADGQTYNDIYGTTNDPGT